MHMQPSRFRALALVAAVAALAFSGWAGADPPSRVARVGYMTGAVSFSPAGESDWVQATINRPLTTGDRLWADSGARAEIQVGVAMIRMNAGTGVSVLNLDDRITQLQLTQGALNVRVRRLEPGQVFEVDTPNLAFTLRQPGEYRIEVDAEGDATTIVVRKGQGEAYGEDAAYVIDSRQPYRFTGTGLREYESVDVPRIDEFDRWSSDRDRSYDNSSSARYVSQDVVGYQDLDANGTWRVDATYGNVWIPTRVAAGWAPYRDGHWAWVDPWGWTWVDDAPWGFAVSHYGRWTNLRGTWGWVPGPVQTRAYYAPALVAFVGGNDFQLTISSGNVGAVAWFPLGPREVYRPSYAVSRRYFENINRSNTVINTTVINNYYNNSNVTNVVYANRQVPGAIIAVPTTAFIQSQPVSRAAVRVSADRIVSAPVAFVPQVAPTEQSVRGAAAQGGKPPQRVFERTVVARTTLPAAHVGFTAQQQQLAAKPGKPLDDAARNALKPAAAAPTPVVKVVAQKQESPPTMRPPQAASAARPDDARAKADERKVPAAPAISRATGAPGAPMQGGSPSQAMSPMPMAQPPEQQRGNGEQRAQPVAPPPVSTQRAAPPSLAPPQQAAPATPAAQSAAPRGKPEQRANGEPRAQPVTPPPVSPQRAPPPAVAPPQQAAQAISAAQSAKPRGKPEQRANGEPRAQPVAPPPISPQRAPPPAVAPPQQAAQATPAAQSAEPRGKPEQRRNVEQGMQPVAPSPAPRQVAVPEPVAQPSAPRAKPESAPAAKQAEPHPPVTATHPPPKLQSAPRAEPRGQEVKPSAGKPADKNKDGEEQKSEADNRKQKG